MANAVSAGIEQTMQLMDNKADKSKVIASYDDAWTISETGGMFVKLDSNAWSCDNPMMALNYSEPSWTLYTIGYAYQAVAPLSATYLYFSGDNGKSFTLERGDVAISADVIYEDTLSSMCYLKN